MRKFLFIALSIAAIVIGAWAALDAAALLTHQPVVLPIALGANATNTSAVIDTGLFKGYGIFMCSADGATNKTVTFEIQASNTVTDAWETRAMTTFVPQSSKAVGYEFGAGGRLVRVLSSGTGTSVVSVTAHSFK